MLASIDPCVEQSVLATEVEPSDGAAENDTDGRSEVHREGEDETRAVVAVQVRCPDIRGIAQCVDQRIDHRSLDVGSRDRGGDPGEDDDGGGVERRGQDAHGKVSSRRVGRREGDDVADDGDEKGANDMQPSLYVSRGTSGKDFPLTSRFLSECQPLTKMAAQQMR